MRKTFVTQFIIVAAILAFAYYQYNSLPPCPLCELQEIITIIMLTIMLLTVIHNPKNSSIHIYGWLLVIFALIGASLAGWQTWLQHDPTVQSCSLGLGYLLKALPLKTAITAVLKGAGECANEHWRFLRLTMAQWGIVFFIVIAVINLKYTHKQCN